MNERIKELAKEAGLKVNADGEISPAFFGSVDAGYRKFAELIIQDVLNLFGDELISLHYLEQPCCEDAVYLLRSKVMDRFGVK